MSGGSLSRFSSRYLTSDISKQPALLNSITVISHKTTGEPGKVIPVPNFKAEASSSSACCRFRKRDMGVREWQKFPQALYPFQFTSFKPTCIALHEMKRYRVHKNRRIHRGEAKGNRREQERPNSTTCGETQQMTLELKEGKTSTTLAKQRSKTILVYCKPKFRPRHRPAVPSVDAGPSVFSPPPSKVIDSTFPANDDSSILNSSASLSWHNRLPSCGPPPLGYRTNADPCDPGPEEAGVMIDLFDVGLFHAPLTAGVRLSEFDGIFDSGGKSADCKNTGGKCCTFC